MFQAEELSTETCYVLLLRFSVFFLINKVGSEGQNQQFAPLTDSAWCLAELNWHFMCVFNILWLGLGTLSGHCIPG